MEREVKLCLSIGIMCCSDKIVTPWPLDKPTGHWKIVCIAQDVIIRASSSIQNTRYHVANSLCSPSLQINGMESSSIATCKSQLPYFSYVTAFWLQMPSETRHQRTDIAQTWTRIVSPGNPYAAYLCVPSVSQILLGSACVETRHAAVPSHWLNWTCIFVVVLPERLPLEWLDNIFHIG